MSAPATWVQRLKLSIGVRLFLALLISMAVVAGVGLGLVRWSFGAGAATGSANRERALLAGAARALSVAYRTHGGWSFMPADRATRMQWLGQWMASPADSGSTVAPRLALLDAGGQVLAGTRVHPLLVALASIDRVRRDILVDGRPVGALVLAVPRNPDDALAVAFMISRQRQLAWLAAAGFALSALAAALVATGFRRPIAALARGAHLLRAARFETRIPANRSDELGDLARAFNMLAERLEDSEESRRQWVADTSHELRTPLAVMRAQLEAMQDGVRPPTTENLALLHRHADALSRLVDDLDALAQADLGALNMEPVSLDAWALATEVWSGFAERFREAGLTATLGDAPASAHVLADPLRLRQVLSNLLGNSARYTTSGGQVRLSGRVTEDHLEVVLDDSTPGVPPAALARLGERFFRVEPSRSRAHGGAGLGLALCRRLLETQGAGLAFAASPLGGLRAVVSLPLER
ncbi:MAG TPA: ATP-binding protein [Rhodanobacteraceae bacterium]|nr:ATP-binding protein [Rhodanobacteraceae bacterium]